jgi:hypothetical protein
MKNRLLLLISTIIIEVMLVACGGGGGGGSSSGSNSGGNQAAQTDFYVATNGSDSNSGTLDSPFASIQKCASTAQSGATCHIESGTYYETVTPNSGITITPYNNQIVTIDGTDAITGWTKYSGSIYKAPAQMSWGDTNQVFVGQQMMTEARWPNGDDLFQPNWATAQSGTAATTLVDSNLPGGNWVGGHIHWWSGSDPWDPQTGVITASSSGQASFNVDGASFGSYIIPQSGGYYYLFGSLAALDAAREWYYDSSAGNLYFYAPGGVNPSTLNVRAKQRQYAFDLSSKTNVTISNINLFASSINMNSNSSNNVITGIKATYPSHFTTLKDNAGYPSSYWYTHLADSGIIVNGSNNSVTNSTVSYSAGNGITVLGTNHNIKNNLIHHIDYIGNYTSGISLQGTGHKIQNNTIYAVGRIAIFPNSIQNYLLAPSNNDISYNNIFNVAMFSRDVGAIYVGGQPGVTGSRIHHNWIHDSQSLYPGPASTYPVSGIYLDEDSSGWEVDQNILWNNQFYNIFIHGSSSGVAAPNNNNIHNNSIPDAGSTAYILLQDVNYCGTTQVINNNVLVAAQQVFYPPITGPNCTFTNNTSSAPGASDNVTAAQVGCNFSGCSSSQPPSVVGNIVSASIATQPYDLSVSVGSTATFTVTGAGSGSLTYQWKRNGVNIGGATGSSYITPTTSLSDSGSSYSVTVTNSLGSITSSAAVLTVN